MYSTIRRRIKTTVKPKIKVRTDDKKRPIGGNYKPCTKKAKKTIYTKNIVGQKSKKASTQINETTLFNLAESSYDKGRKYLSVYGNEKFTNVIKEKVEPKVLNETQYFTVFELLLPRLDDLLDIYKDNLPFLYRGLSEMMRYNYGDWFALRQIFKIEESRRELKILRDFEKINKLKYIHPYDFKLYDLASKDLDKEKQQEKEIKIKRACKIICPNVLNTILQELEKLALFKKQCELYGAELVEKGDDFFFNLKDFSQTKLSEKLTEEERGRNLWASKSRWKAFEKDRLLAKDTKVLRYKDEVVTHINEVKISYIDISKGGKIVKDTYKRVIIRDKYANIYTGYLPLVRKRNIAKKAKKTIDTKIKRAEKDKKRKTELLGNKPSTKRKPRTKIGCFTAVFSKLEKPITKQIKRAKKNYLDDILSKNKRKKKSKISRRMY